MPSVFATTVQTIRHQPNFAGLLGATFALGMGFSFVAPFLSKWGTEAVGMSPLVFSFFMTAVSLSAIIVSTVLGRFSDTRIPRRHLLLLGSGGGMLGYAGYAFLRDPWVLILVGCTLQALASVCFSQLFSHVREAFCRQPEDGAQSGFLMSVVRVCFSFSWTVGPAAGSVMLIAFGFEGLFLAAAGLFGIFFLGVLRFVPLAPPMPVAAARGESVWRTLRRPDLLLCFVAFAAVFAAHAINMLNLPLALTRTLGGTERDFGIVFGIGPLVEIPLMLWFGHLAGRGHQLLLIRLGVVVTLAYFVGLFFAASPMHVYALQVLNGVSFAILTNVAILFFQDLLPGQMGLATAIFGNAQAVGGLVGMLSFGFVVEALGHQASFLVCAASCVLALGLILLYRPRPG
jgi:MFS transporter, SET family, sugar efflux transporter